MEIEFDYQRSRFFFSRLNFCDRHVAKNNHWRWDSEKRKWYTTDFASLRQVLAKWHECIDLGPGAAAKVRMCGHCGDAQLRRAPPPPQAQAWACGECGAINGAKQEQAQAAA